VRVDTSGKVKVAGKGVKRVSMLQKLCIHVCVNAKMIPVETIPGIGGREIKESSERSKFKYDIFDTLKELL
jgi:hypothetical protein